MSNIEGQGSLFNEGESLYRETSPRPQGSNPNVERTIDEAAITNVAMEVEQIQLLYEKIAQLSQNLTASQRQALGTQQAHTKELKEQARILTQQEAVNKRIADAEARVKDKAGRGRGAQGSMTPFRLLAREAGYYRDKEGFLTGMKEGKPVYSREEEVLQAMKNNDPMYRELRKNIQTHLAPRDTGAASRNFRLEDMVTSLATGNLWMAAGELFQPIGGGRMAGYAERMQESAQRTAERGGVGGFMGSGMKMLAARAMSPAALIAAQQAFTRGTRAYRQTVAGGQVTGEGFGAGLASQWETIRLGVNPFDLLDRRTAQQMVQATRAQGYRGELGQDIQDSLGEIYKDLGTDFNEVLQILSKTVDQGAMSIDEFTDMMKGLDTTAKETGLSVATIQKNLAQIQSGAGAAGGVEAGAIAMRMFPGTQSAFGGAISRQLEAGGSSLAQFQTAVLPIVGQSMGMTPAQAVGPEGQRMAGPMWDRWAELVESYRPPGYNNQQFAAHLAVENTGARDVLFPGIQDAAIIEQMLNRVTQNRRQGTSFTEQIAKKVARDAMGVPKEKTERHWYSGIGDFIKPGGTMDDALSGVGSGLWDRLTDSEGILDRELRGDASDFSRHMQASLRTAGLSPQEITSILGDFNRVVKDPKSSYSDITAAAERAQMETGRVIEIKLIPTGALKGLVEDPGGVQIYEGYRRGMNGSQGGRRVPGG